jgi:transposase
MSTNATIDRLDEFANRIFEAADNLINTPNKRVIFSDQHLEFYGKDITSFLKSFKEQLRIISGPAHPDDERVTWKVFVDKRDGIYYLHARKS